MGTEVARTAQEGPIVLVNEEIIKSFNDQEYKAYQEIKAFIQKEQIRELKERYRLAVKIHKIYTETKKEQSIYGKDFLNRLAAALGYRSAGPFREMIRVVERWPTFQELETAILGRIQHVTWKKLVFLTRLEDEDIDKSIDTLNSLSTTALQEYTKTDKPKQGRKYAPAASIDDLLMDMERTLMQLSRKIDQKWYDFDMKKGVQELESIIRNREEDREEVIWERLENILALIDEAVSDLHIVKSSVETLKDEMVKLDPKAIRKK